VVVFALLGDAAAQGDNELPIVVRNNVISH
jgi:hypothetical protein